MFVSLKILRNQLRSGIESLTIRIPSRPNLIVNYDRNPIPGTILSQPSQSQYKIDLFLIKVDLFLIDIGRLKDRKS